MPRKTSPVKEERYVQPESKGHTLIKHGKTIAVLQLFKTQSAEDRNRLPHVMIGCQQVQVVSVTRAGIDAKSRAIMRGKYQVNYRLVKPRGKSIISQVFNGTDTLPLAKDCQYVETH